jgi:hypothetical protein
MSREWSEIARRVLLALIPIGLALAFWWVQPHIIIDADTPRYLANSPMRTATYPLFLDVAYGPALLPLQLLLFAAALAWLAIYSSRFLPWLLCVAMVVAIGANPYVWELQASIMSEALTIPLLAIIVGCVLGFLIEKRTALVVVAAILGGLATTIRPPLLPFILTLLVAVWITTELPTKKRLTVLVVLAWLAPVAAERLYSQVVHGSELTSPMGRALFMKSAVIDAPETAVQGDALDRRLVQFINGDYGPVRRLVDRATDRDVRNILVANYEACAGYPCLMSIVDSYNVEEAELHRRLAHIGLSRLLTNPAGYLELAATEYERLWLLHPRKVPALATKYNVFLAREAPIPFERQLGEIAQPTPASEQKQIYRLNRAAFLGIGVAAAILTVGLAFWRRGPLLQSAFALLVGTQCVLVFGTLVGSGLPRYTMGMWPALISAELFGLVGLLALWKPNWFHRVNTDGRVYSSARSARA